MHSVLVADDNSNIQKMVSLALQDLGIEVVAVGNGEAAIRKLSDYRPDVILADIFMPLRNGYELCEFVKKSEQLANIPVILLVGSFDPLDEEEARRVGANGVLKKPFVPPDPLIEMVQAALAQQIKEQPQADLATQAEVFVPVEVAQTAEAAAILTAAVALHTVPPAEDEPEEYTQPVEPAGLRGQEAAAGLAFGSLLAPAEQETQPLEDEYPPFEASSVAGIDLEAAVERTTGRDAPLWGSLQVEEPVPHEPAAEAAPLQPQPSELDPLRQLWEQSFVPPAAADREPRQSAAEAEPVASAAAPATDTTSPPGTVPEATVDADMPAAAHPSDEGATQHLWPGSSLPAPVAEPAEPAEPLVAQPSEPAEPIEWTRSRPELPADPQAPPSLSKPEALPAAEATQGAVDVFPVRAPVDPELIERVVQQVLQRVQPEFERVARDILRQVAESLLARELHPDKPAGH